MVFAKKKKNHDDSFNPLQAWGAQSQRENFPLQYGANNDFERLRNYFDF